jgi:hypothetical protein
LRAIGAGAHIARVAHATFAVVRTFGCFVQVTRSVEENGTATSGSGSAPMLEGGVTSE